MNAKSSNRGAFLSVGKNFVNTGMDRSEKVLKYSLEFYPLDIKSVLKILDSLEIILVF